MIQKHWEKGHTDLLRIRIEISFYKEGKTIKPFLVFMVHKA